MLVKELTSGDVFELIDKPGTHYILASPITLSAYQIRRRLLVFWKWRIASKKAEKMDPNKTANRIGRMENKPWPQKRGTWFNFKRPK